MTDETKAGRPTEYKPEYAAQVQKLCQLGATDEEVANFFEVSARTIYRWAARHDEFCQALKAGKEIPDERVARSLYHKAVGYTFDSEKVFQFQGEIVRAPIKEHVPPDTTAMIFWLKNRRKDEWRDRIDHELSGKDGGAIKIEDASPTDTARRIAFILASAEQAKKET